jgi:ubiquinol-cytochrome c reductase cytochrome b subunit
LQVRGLQIASVRFTIVLTPLDIARAPKPRFLVRSSSRASRVETNTIRRSERMSMETRTVPANEFANEAPIATKDRPGVGERFGWNGMRYAIAPSANRLPYMLGGLTFCGILVLTATGILLDQFYNPSAVGAHESIVYIMTRVPLGNWLRSLHYWTATLVLVSVVCHLVYVFSRRSYVRPREIQWWSGVALLALLFAITFTGTVLRGDQEGGEALAHAIAGAQFFGALGAVMSPDFARSTSLIARMHNAHVSLLPFLMFALIGLHFWLVRQFGIHTTEARTAVFTSHLQKLTGVAFVCLGLLALLSALVPPGLGYPAVDGVEVTKPYWPFLWIYSAENTFGMAGMIIAPAVFFGFLFLIPLVDRGDSERARPRWLLAAGVLILGLYIGAMIYGVFAPQMQHLGM